MTTIFILHYCKRAVLMIYCSLSEKHFRSFKISPAITLLNLQMHKLVIVTPKAPQKHSSSHKASQSYWSMPFREKHVIQQRRIGTNHQHLTPCSDRVTAVGCLITALGLYDPTGRTKDGGDIKL